MAEELDPIRYEIFRHRMFQILEEGRIAIKMVSGSPVVVEGGETMCSYHLSDGTTTLVAAGILLHAIGSRDFVVKTIQWYEEDPGIYDGDQFFWNDPYIGGQHLADMVVVKPIFYEGKRVAWTGSIMHTAETGGIDPGGQSTHSTEIFHEGIRIMGLKIVDQGQFRQDVFNTIVLQTRAPDLVGLDLKAKVAACNVCAKRYVELIETFGLDFVEPASQKIIDDAERMVRDKLRALPDGVWRSRLYNDQTGLGKEEPKKVQCTVTKIGEEITFDYSGTGRQNEGSVNLTRPGTQGHLFVLLCSQLFWDVPWNDGMHKPVTLITPEGTLVNCTFPTSTANGVLSIGGLVRTTAHECIAKMLFAGGDKDVNAAWRGACGAAPYFGGIDQFGKGTVGIILESFVSGIGATQYRDGVDTGANMLNPQSQVSDLEIIEMNYPFLSLGRKEKIDSGGFGKFQGGMAPEQILMAYGTDNLRVGFFGNARRITPNFGMFGGYPGGVMEARYAINSELLEWFKQSKIPQTYEDMEALGGRVVDPPNSYHGEQLKEYDVFIYRHGGGGGYGDPLDRDPKLVVETVKRRATSLDVARLVYGVIINAETLEINEKATEKRREEIRKERRENAKPASSYYK